MACNPLSGETLVHIFVLVVSEMCTTLFSPLNININWVKMYIDTLPTALCKNKM